MNTSGLCGASKIFTREKKREKKEISLNDYMVFIVRIFFYTHKHSVTICHSLKFHKRILFSALSHSLIHSFSCVEVTRI